jgi:hypothetical protein
MISMSIYEFNLMCKVKVYLKVKDYCLGLSFNIKI